MATMVGADVAGLRAFAGDLDTAARGVHALITELHAGLRKADAWRGRDADQFRNGWDTTLRPRLLRAAEALERAAREARRQADDQERTSDTDGSSGPSGPSSIAPTDRDNSDPRDLGDLDPEIAEQWGEMDRQEREFVLRQIINELADEYGVRQPGVVFRDLSDDAGNTIGSWQEGFLVFPPTLYIDSLDEGDPTALHDPLEVLNGVAHEMRHGAQYQAIRDAVIYDLFEEEIAAGEIPYPFAPGITPEQAAAWEESFDQYEWPETPEELEAYWAQTVEVDARQSAHNYVDDLTVEQFEAYRQEYAEHREALEDLVPPVQPHWPS